jgi:hypothetical protein
MSEMEEVLRRAERHWDNGQERQAFRALIEAIKKQERDLENLRCNRGIRRNKPESPNV